MKLKLEDLKKIIKDAKNGNNKSEDIIKKKKKPKDNNIKEPKKKEKLLLGKLNEAVGKMSEISVDDQIDALLIGFEKDSLANKNKYQTTYDENNDIDKFMKRILEAEGNEEDNNNNNIKTSKDIDVERGVNPEIPKLDMNEFAKRVSRLIVNRDNLLDVKTVIYNRASRYMEENLGKDEAIKLQDILENEYDIMKEKEYHKEFPVNYAVGAGPSLGG